MSTTARAAVLLRDGNLPTRLTMPPALGEALAVLPTEVEAAGLQGLGYREKAG